MRLLATAKQDNQPALNIAFTATRITQQGVHAGDNFFSWDDYTFEETSPLERITEAFIEELECAVKRGIATQDELDVWELIK